MPKAARIMIRALLLVGSAMWATFAEAYIGPGAGIGLLGSILGISSLVVVGIVFSVLWPVWLLVKFFRRKKQDGEDAGAPQNEDPASKA